MTLRLEQSTGSGELKSYLEALHLPVEVGRFAFGDACFLGRGPEDVPVPVGIERKAIKDFITSMIDKRLPAHQLPGLLRCYEQIWIVVEGSWRIDPHSGKILVPKGKKWVPVEPEIMYTSLEGMFLTLEQKGSVFLRRTTGKFETCRFINTCYRWWQKAWDDHDSLSGYHSGHPDPNLLVPPSLCKVWAHDLPGIGWGKAGAVADHFKVPILMASADTTEWEKIPGIGPTIAQKAVKAIMGEKE